MSIRLRSGLALAATLALGAAVALAPSSAQSAKPEQPPLVPIQMLAINDFHGNLAPPSGSSGTVTRLNADGTTTPQTVGGAAYLATHLQMARAGHPYPLLLHPERGPSFLTGAHGPALGMGAEASFCEQESAIEAGSTLLLYTDGLIERARIPDAESALAATASASVLDPETLCDSVIRRFVRGRRSTDDDVALLAVRNAGIGE